MPSPRSGTPEFFKLHRRRELTMWREMTKAPAVEVLGIVAPGSVGGGKSREDRQWTLDFQLVPWRVSGGPVHREELTVRKRVGERAIAIMQRRLGERFTVVRLRARVAYKNAWGTPQAKLIRILAINPSSSAARALLKEVATPRREAIAGLGRLSLDRASGTWEGRVPWSGKLVGLSIPAQGDAPNAKELKTAQALVRSHAKWDREVRAVAAKKLLRLAHQWAIEAGERPVDEKRFISRLQLKSIDLRGRGRFTFWFDDGGLFAGHAVTVSGDLKRGPRTASIEG